MTPQPVNKSNSVTTTVRLDRAVSDQLRHMAFESRRSQNDLIITALHTFLRVSGYQIDTPSTRED